MNRTFFYCYLLSWLIVQTILVHANLTAAVLLACLGVYRGWEIGLWLSDKLSN